VQCLAGVANELPLAPCLGKIEGCAEAEFANDEGVFGMVVPAIRQAVAVQEDVAAFQSAIRLAIKMIAKGQRIGHIALSPVQHVIAGAVRFYVFGMCHGPSR